MPITTQNIPQALHGGIPFSEKTQLTQPFIFDPLKGIVMSHNSDINTNRLFVEDISKIVSDVPYLQDTIRAASQYPLNGTYFCATVGEGDQACVVFGNYQKDSYDYLGYLENVNSFPRSSWHPMTIYNPNPSNSAIKEIIAYDNIKYVTDPPTTVTFPIGTPVYRAFTCEDLHTLMVASLANTISINQMNSYRVDASIINNITPNSTSDTAIGFALSYRKNATFVGSAQIVIPSDQNASLYDIENYHICIQAIPYPGYEEYYTQYTIYIRYTGIDTPKPINISVLRQGT